MSGIDIEGTLSARWPAFPGEAFTASDGHTSVRMVSVEDVAAVLREQIVTWLTSEALRTDLLAQVNAEDDAQFAGGASHGLGAHDATDFVLAALAAHLSDTERAGGAG